jgi:hypothetical protein
MNWLSRDRWKRYRSAGDGGCDLGTSASSESPGSYVAKEF